MSAKDGTPVSGKIFCLLCVSEEYCKYLGYCDHRKRREITTAIQNQMAGLRASHAELERALIDLYNASIRGRSSGSKAEKNAAVALANARKVQP